MTSTTHHRTSTVSRKCKSQESGTTPTAARVAAAHYRGGMRHRTRSVRDLLSFFLASLERRAADGEIAHNTPAQYRYRLHFAAALGPVRLQDLKVEQLQRWLLGLEHPQATVRAAVAALVQAIRFGRRLGWLHHAPELGLVRPPPERKPPRPMNELELRLFFERCTAHCQRLKATGLQLAQLTAVASCLGGLCLLGTRVGELRSARRDALDLVDGTLQLRGKTGLRRTALSRPAAQLLAQRVALIGDEHDYLFPGRGAHPISQSAVYRGFQRLGGDVARGRHPHDLRHSFVRMLRRRGKSWAQCADALGHASELTTREVYGTGDDANPDAREAADIIGGLLVGEVFRG